MNTTKSWMERQIESLEKMTAADWAHDAEGYHHDRLASVVNGLNGWDAYSLPAGKAAELRSRVDAVFASRRVVV